jgi:hypothetical protein
MKRTASSVAELAALLLVVMVCPTIAGSATWATNPPSSDWHSELNWVPQTIPNQSTDTASFGASQQTTVMLLEAGASLNGITFNAGASAFTIALDQQVISFSGSGVVNLSGIVQKFVLGPTMANASAIGFQNSANAGASVIFDNSGFVSFQGASTAGSATFVIHPSINLASAPRVEFFNSSNAGSGIFTADGGASSNRAGGMIEFGQTSSASLGKFTFNGTTASGGYGSVIHFNGSASAGNGDFTINGSAFNNGFSPPAEGYGTFSNQASASNARFTINGSIGGGGTGAFLQFGAQSTASNAILVANGGSGGGEGGSIVFFGTASGGT